VASAGDAGAADWAGAPAVAAGDAASGEGAAAAGASARPFALRRDGAAAFAAPSAAWGVAACWEANASLSLRTTGASIVEDADRTNSPISWSLAITALLSTPNSLASSYTRTFATALPLLGPDSRTLAPTGAARAPAGVSLCCSSPHAHRALIAISAFSLPGASCRPRRASPTEPPGIPRACRPAGLPAGEVLSGTPVDAGLAPSMPGLDADMHPGQAAAWQHQELSRPLLRPRG